MNVSILGNAIIFDSDSRTINEVKIEDLDANLQYKLPNDVIARCEPCKLDFKIDGEMQKHWKEIHEGRQK